MPLQLSLCFQVNIKQSLFKVRNIFSEVVVSLERSFFRVVYGFRSGPLACLARSLIKYVTPSGGSCLGCLRRRAAALDSLLHCSHQIGKVVILLTLNGIGGPGSETGCVLSTWYPVWGYTKGCRMSHGLIFMLG